MEQLLDHIDQSLIMDNPSPIQLDQEKFPNPILDIEITSHRFVDV